MHKSVLDWLRHKEFKSEFKIDDAQIKRANADLSKECNKQVQTILMQKDKDPTPESDTQEYSLRHLIAHTCDSGDNNLAVRTILNFEFLLASAKFSPLGLLDDTKRVEQVINEKESPNRTENPINMGSASMRLSTLSLRKISTTKLEEVTEEEKQAVQLVRSAIQLAMVKSDCFCILYK